MGATGRPGFLLTQRYAFVKFVFVKFVRFLAFV